MAWMQTTVPHLTDPKPLRGALLNLAIAGTAGGKLNPELALLSRDVGDQTIVLMSPAAVRYAEWMPGEWVEVADPEVHVWKMIYSTGIEMDELGLKEAD